MKVPIHSRWKLKGLETILQTSHRKEGWQKVPLTGGSQSQGGIIRISKQHTGSQINMLPSSLESNLPAYVVFPSFQQLIRE